MISLRLFSEEYVFLICDRRHLLSAIDASSSGRAGRSRGPVRRSAQAVGFHYRPAAVGPGSGWDGPTATPGAVVPGGRTPRWHGRCMIMENRWPGGRRTRVAGAIGLEDFWVVPGVREATRRIATSPPRVETRGEG